MRLAGLVSGALRYKASDLTFHAASSRLVA